MLKYIIVSGLALAGASAHAGEIVTATVSHDEKRYFIEVEALLDADSRLVKRALTDYNHLKSVNDIIQESYVMYSLDDVSHRVYVKTRTCITFFCKTIIQVQDVEELAGNVIVAQVVPEKSDFEYAHARWKISPAGKQTRIHFSTDLKPAFWVPPLIGPPLLERKLRQEVLRTIDGLERLANNN